jgi:signal peptidase I
MGTKTTILTTLLALLVITLTASQFQSTDQFPFSTKATEHPSPSDWLTKDQIKVHKTDVKLDVQNAIFTTYANTNSMDPVLDENTHGIEIKPQEDQLRIGDIISYESTRHNVVIVHRITSINEDKLGTYYTVKGDNNATEDQERIRFNQIRGVVVALIY